MRPTVRLITADIGIRSGPRHAGDGYQTSWWGGWGSNPRPADYEKYGPVHRTHYLHGYREAVPLITLIALLAPMARSTNRSTARRGPPPAPLLYVTSPGAPVPQPRERIAILCLGARHALFWCWT